MKNFKKIYIEITNMCNLSCSFCPKTRRQGRFMKEDLFRKILDDIKSHTKYLYFHVLGEPLSHPELEHFLDLCREYNYKVNITTNGTLINKAGDMLLNKPALRQVNFSLHSFEANNRECPIDMYLDNIFDFVYKARSSSNIQICLRLWNLSQVNAPEENRYILGKLEKAFSYPGSLEEKLTPCNGIKLADGVFLNQSSTFRWPDINDEDISERGFCYGLRDQIAILVDGTVVPCCLDGEGAVNLGNINEQSFSDIVDSPRARELYEGFSRRRAVEALCRKCQYRTRFDL